MNALFSSKSDLWGTPPEVFHLLNEFYDFQLDAASTHQNALCPNHFTIEDNSLEQDWFPYRRVWLNPPYGKTIGHWMKKAYEESQKGCLVVCLVPARVDTRWWHDWVRHKGIDEYFKGRLKYINFTDGSGQRSGTSPFASALVTYVPDLSNRFQYLDRPAPYECKSHHPRLEYKSLGAGREANGFSHQIRSGFRTTDRGRFQTTRL
ncbi:MAG: hypothetical protein EVA70_07345 [Parvularculaceae bacterium]|nr:MAG: hypothetical protein EVA70_07345 [Parvularculaceae bacterium]